MIKGQTKNPDIGEALGRIASGVYVVTWQHDKTNHGILATWINQVSFEPPMLSIAFNKERSILYQLSIGSHLTVNILSKSHPDLFKKFAKANKENEDRFADISILSQNKNGTVLGDALAYLTCEITANFEAGDHVLTVAKIISGKLLQSDGEPMTHIRRSGYHY